MNIIKNRLSRYAIFLILGSVIIFCSIIITGFCVLRYAGPIHSKSLANLTEIIIAKKIPGAISKVGDLALSINSNNQIEIMLDNTSILYSDSEISVPSVKIVLAFQELLLGKALASVKSLSFPANIKVSLQEKKALLKENHVSINWQKFLKKYIFDEENVFLLKTILGQIGFQLQLSINDHDIIMKLEQFDLLVKNNQTAKHVQFYGKMKVDDEFVKLDFSLHDMQQGIFALDGQVDALPAKFIFPKSDLFFGDLKVDCKIQSQINQAGIEDIQFKIACNHDSVLKNQNLKTPLILKKIDIVGKWKLKQDEILFDLFLQTKEDVLFQGSVTKFLHNISGNISATKMPRNLLMKYWPDHFFPRVHYWMRSNLQGGTVDGIEMRLDLDTRNLEKLKKDAINIKVMLSDIMVRYMPIPVPIVKVKKSVINISAEDVIMQLNEAYIAQSKTTNTRGVINYKQGEIFLVLSGAFTGPVQNVIDVGFAHARSANNKLKNFYGKAVTDIKMCIPLGKEFKINRENIIISTKFNGVTSSKLANLLFFDHLKGEMLLEGMKLSIRGQGTINNLFYSDFNTSYDLQEDPDIKISAVVLTKSQELFKHGLIQDHWINGTIKTMLDIRMFKDHYEIKSLSFLDKVSINHPLGIIKSLNSRGNLVLNFSGKLNENLQKISLYHLDIPNLQISGYGSFDKERGITSLVSESDVSSNNKFNFNYQKNEKSDAKLELYGNKIDLSGIRVFKLFRNLGKKSIYALDVKVNLKNAVLHQGQILFSPQLRLKYANNRCQYFELSGSFYDNKRMNIIYNDNIVSIVAEDAGKTLSAFGIYDKVKAGHLEFKGEFNPKDMMQGELVLKNYYVEETSGLVKMLTIFAALPNPLSIKKISFSPKKLIATIKYSQNKIYVDKFFIFDKIAKINGLAVMNTKNMSLAGQGSIISSNIINRAAETLPLLGNLITGRGNTGIIAANFSITGNVDNVKYTINPFSVLMPGFLGEIFIQEKKFKNANDFPK